MFVTLSPESKYRILAAGLGKSKAEIIAGIKRGNQNIARKNGGVFADVKAATPEQIAQAKALNQEMLADAIRRGDKTEQGIIEKVLANLEKSDGMNPIKKQQMDSYSTTAKASKNPLDKLYVWGKNYGIKRSNDYAYMGTDPSTRLIYTEASKVAIPKNKEEEELFKALLARHEALELVETNRLLRMEARNPEAFKERAKRGTANFYDNWIRVGKEKYGPVIEKPALENKNRVLNSLEENNINSQRIMAGNPYSGAGYIKETGDQLGSHVDANVLIKERKTVDRLPFLFSEGAEKMHNLRALSGELELMDTAGGYAKGTPGRFNKVHARRFRKAIRGPVTLSEGTYIPISYSEKL